MQQAAVSRHDHSQRGPWQMRIQEVPPFVLLFVGSVQGLACLTADWTLSFNSMPQQASLSQSVVLFSVPFQGCLL